LRFNPSDFFANSVFFKSSFKNNVRIALANTKDAKKIGGPAGPVYYAIIETIIAKINPNILELINTNPVITVAS
jgi:hypothetical protein